ncbi:hypothetical protein P692DRAFT_20871078 [Suillus brevipes Sb2]|nr:hypothetical protein P692DRAFT_20871078 [Suillus brevipes Sb2]
MLVHFLINNPADCRILFSSEGKRPADPDIEGPPSGKDKNPNMLPIRLGFVTLWATVLQHDLWNKFCDHHNEFESTGAGIVPLNAGTAENLYTKVKKDFPWYNDLYKIWGSHPSFAAKTTSAKSSSDHVGDLFALTHPGGSSACPPPQHNTSSIPPHQSGQPGSVPGPHSQWNYKSAHSGSVSAPQFNFGLPQSTQPGSPQHWNYGPPPQGGFTGGVPAPQYNFGPPQQSVQPNVPPSSTSGSPQCWNFAPSPQSAQTCNPYSPGPPAFSKRDDDDNNNNNNNNNNNTLADNMEDLCMDESDGRHDIILDSPPKPNHHPKKHQQPPSSPTPSPPLAFAAPQKPRTATHDNCGAFKTHASQLNSPQLRKHLFQPNQRQGISVQTYLIRSSRTSRDVK